MKGTIELPTKFFQFIELTKNGKGFFVKCLKCHEFKTVYNKKGNIELLSVTRNVILISHISFNVRPLPLSIDRFLMKANLKKTHRFVS